MEQITNETAHMGTIGHVDHGRTILTAAITTLLANNKPVSIQSGGTSDIVTVDSENGMAVVDVKTNKGLIHEFIKESAPIPYVASPLVKEMYDDPGQWVSWSPKKSKRQFNNRKWGLLPAKKAHKRRITKCSRKQNRRS